MSHLFNKYHKEYSCIPQIVEEEKTNIAKRFNRNNRVWILYLSLLIISFSILPIWMTSLICLGGFILFPATINQKGLLKEKPFLVVDTKYIQFKGKTLNWNKVSGIVISYETFNKKKEAPYNYTISFKYHSGREVHVDTFYFSEQEDIISSIISIAQFKNIPIDK